MSDSPRILENDRPYGFGIAGTPLGVADGSVWAVLERVYTGAPAGSHSGKKQRADYIKMQRYSDRWQMCARAEFYARAARSLMPLLDVWNNPANHVDHLTYGALVEEVKATWKDFVDSFADGSKPASRAGSINRAQTPIVAVTEAAREVGAMTDTGPRGGLGRVRDGRGRYALIR